VYDYRQFLFLFAKQTNSNYCGMNDGISASCECWLSDREIVAAETTLFMKHFIWVKRRKHL